MTFWVFNVVAAAATRTDDTGLVGRDNNDALMFCCGLDVITTAVNKPLGVSGGWDTVDAVGTSVHRATVVKALYDVEKQGSDDKPFVIQPTAVATEPGDVDTPVGDDNDTLAEPVLSDDMFAVTEEIDIFVVNELPGLDDDATSPRSSNRGKAGIGAFITVVVRVLLRLTRGGVPLNLNCGTNARMVDMSNPAETS